MHVWVLIKSSYSIGTIDKRVHLMKVNKSVLLNLKNCILKGVFMRKYITFFLIFGILISWSIGQVDIVNAKNKSSKCNLAGTWRVNDGFATFIPLDPTGRNFSVLVDAPLPEDPTFLGFFDGVDPADVGASISPTRGIAKKVSNNLYKFTLTKNILNVYGDKIGGVELSGETKFIDCDYRVLRYRVKLFDADGGLIICLSPPVTYTNRYEFDEPCGDFPDFPE